MTYEEHMKQVASRQSNNLEDRTEVHFVNEFFKNSDTLIVKFPYRSKNDFIYTPVHLIKNYPGFKYGRQVICTGADCPLCKDPEAAFSTHIFVKMLVYTIENGQVKLNNAIWDRKSAFADIDLSDKIDNYGDLTLRLFKLKKSGSGTATRYTLDLIDNTTIYPPDVYVADFTELDKIDADRICAKTYAQYQAALNPNIASVATPVAAPMNTAPTYTAPVETAPVYTTPAPAAQPAYQAPAAPSYQAPAAPAYQAPAPQATPTYQPPVTPAYQAPQPQVNVPPYQGPVYQAPAPQAPAAGNSDNDRRPVTRRTF